MAARVRLGLVLPDDDDDSWRTYNLQQGFGEVARLAAGAGWDVELIAPTAAARPQAVPSGVRVLDLPKGGRPVLAGPGSTTVTRSLRLGHLLWRHASGAGYDILLGPLAGGLLQPCLMSRATGEALQRTTIMLWGDVPTVRRVQSDATLWTTLKPLVDDALERACARLADFVFVPSEQEAKRMSGFARPGRGFTLARLPTPEIRIGKRAVTKPRTMELAFVGPGIERYGVERLLTVLDRAHAVPGGAERVVFAGPWRSHEPGLSKALLGVRAMGWSVEFEVLDTHDPQAALRRISGPECIALFIGSGTDDDVLVGQATATGAQVILSADHRLVSPSADEPANIEGLSGLVRFRPANASPTPSSDWPMLVHELHLQAQANAAASHREPPSVSVCITHKDRPDALRRAVSSISPGQAQVIVTDTGSRSPAALETLTALEREGATVIRLAASAQGPACDGMAQVAEGEVLAFLDDDNAYREQGWARLASALVQGPFDVVVSNLSLQDGSLDARSPAADLVFLGDAGSAGLFFNGFGDISFVIRRADFLRIGGFGEYDGPALDWVFLARARSLGFRIGVLQAPAVTYLRDVNAVHSRWRKRDGEGARRRVLDSYRGAFDADLIAGFAQAALSEVAHL